MAKLALLIIDLQKVSYRGESAVQMDSAAQYILAALPLFRAKKLPIVWIQNMEEEEGVVPGTEPFEWIEPLVPGEGEYQIVKTYSNSFTKTDLHDILQAEGVDTVIISGYCAEYCVTATRVGAEDRDYTPILYRGGIASGSKENLRAVEDAYEVVSHGALEAWLKGLP